MATKEVQKNLESVDLESLGLAVTQEPDRQQLSPAPAMSLIRYRFDYRTRFWDEKTKTGSPIVKFDAIDAKTSEYLKFWTMSSVVYKNMSEISAAVGVQTEKDSEGVNWMRFKKPVNIGGFEEIPSKTRGQNPYLKMLPAHTG